MEQGARKTLTLQLRGRSLWPSGNWPGV